MVKIILILAIIPKVDIKENQIVYIDGPFDPNKNIELERLDDNLEIAMNETIKENYNCNIKVEGMYSIII